jgi:nucleotide-binding universal stress UspA family protein
VSAVQTRSFRKILCAIDFSEGARGAMAAALDLASDVGATEVTLVHVAHVPGVALPDGYVLGGPEMIQDMLAAVDRELARWRKDAEAHLLAETPIGQRPIVNVKSLLGFAADELVQLARDGEYDVIVAGTHGRTGVAHALLGSVAEKIVRIAPCPVLTVHQAKHANMQPQPHAA